MAMLGPYAREGMYVIITLIVIVVINVWRLCRDLNEVTGKIVMQYYARINMDKRRLCINSRQLMDIRRSLACKIYSFAGSNIAYGLTNMG